MHFRSSLRVGAFLVLAMFGSLTARAYDAVIVFGDSYCDAGNVSYAAAQYGVVYPPPPYYFNPAAPSKGGGGRFSNGPIWLDHLAGAWGLPLAASLAGGTDYAFGGALMLTPTTLQGLPIPSVEEQVAAYLASTGGKADPNALYIIEGGGNDILSATDLSANLGAELGAATVGIVKTLEAAGAKSFLVPDFIDVGLLPAAAAGGPTFIKFASDTSAAVNQILRTSLEAEALKHPSDQFYQISVFQTFLAVAHSKTHFGFTDVVDPCLGASSICADPDHTLFWDDFHPTEFGQAFFATLVEGRIPNH
jgi:outer membrane lipase/esterase